MRHALAMLLLALLTALPVAAEPLLPRPSTLEPAVRFWIRVYSEVDGDAGLIHDSRRLDVVYEAIELGEGLSRRARERRVEAAKRRYADILRRLAAGKRTGLGAEEARVLALWRGASPGTLRKAARNLRFQLGQANRFREGLVRQGRWHDYIERTLREHDVPVALAALPHVESSYNPKAYSRVGAAGMWQFTRSTGRRYLRVDHVVDERLDPFRSTVAAARLLRDNYRITESWPLAITAYNHGAAGMRRAARKLGTRDIGTIVEKYRSRTFGFASRNFYASFLAAHEIDRQPRRYFGVVRTDTPIDYARVELDHYYPAQALERALGIDRRVLREHNPSLRPSVWNGAKYVPRGHRLRLPRQLLSRPLETALARIPAGERFAQQHRDRFYKVRRGDTLSRIARRHRVRQSELVALNNLRSRHRIRVGQVLVLPDDAAGGGYPVSREEPPADGIYTVRRGDSLWKIARRFAVSEAELASANGLRNRNRLAVGQRLRLPGARSAVSAVAATPTNPEPSPTPAESEIQLAARPPEADVIAAREVARAEQARAEAEERAAAPLDAAALAGPPPPETPPSAAAARRAPSSDPSNYAVTPEGSVVVQAEETLGHYAEWLEIPTRVLRRKNGHRYGAALVIGREIRLDFSKVTPATFEQRRLAYHQALQEEFFAAFQVAGTDAHELRRGESLWYLAERQYEIPMWLLRQYNPDLDFGALQAGTTLVIPRLEPRGDQT